MRIVESEHMVREVYSRPLRRKKNNRWVKKWKKKYTNFMPMEDFLVSKRDDTIICHPIMAAKLREVWATQRLPRVAQVENSYMGHGLGWGGGIDWLRGGL